MTYEKLLEIALNQWKNGEISLKELIVVLKIVNRVIKKRK